MSPLTACDVWPPARSISTWRYRAIGTAEESHYRSIRTRQPECYYRNTRQAITGTRYIAHRLFFFLLTIIRQSLMMITQHLGDRFARHRRNSSIDVMIANDLMTQKRACNRPARSHKWMIRHMQPRYFIPSAKYHVIYSGHDVRRGSTYT